ncbi:MAG: hypothetical protein IKJ03_01890 [Mycoplasmataceae bacterium]|nr:hypothetical protein [Mycoplasmataceae bacterium]
MKSKMQFRKNDYDQVLEEMIQEIEDKQIEQIELINLKENEIDDLAKKNEELEKINEQLKKEIEQLKLENKNLKILIDSNDKKFKIREENLIIKSQQKISELTKIIEMYKKIDEQDEKIKKLKFDIQ